MTCPKGRHAPPLPAERLPGGLASEQAPPRAQGGHARTDDGVAALVDEADGVAAVENGLYLARPGVVMWQTRGFRHNRFHVDASLFDPFAALGRAASRRR